MDADEDEYDEDLDESIDEGPAMSAVEFAEAGGEDNKNCVIF